MVNTVTLLFKSRITEHVSDRIRDFVQDTIDEMNESQFQYSSQAEMQQKIIENVWQKIRIWNLNEESFSNSNDLK